MEFFAFLPILIVLGLLVYLAQSARTIGTKLSAQSTANTKKFREIEGLIFAQGQSAKGRDQLLYLPMLEQRGVDWKFVVSLTSHAKRFSTLAQVLQGLQNQILKPESIFLNIAHGDLASLPTEVKELEASGFIKIVACDDLGPAKKLIPTLLAEKKLPIITIDDDLEYEPELFLQLMIGHYLFPKCVIAARVHRVAAKDGAVESFANWEKHFDKSEGPRADFLATSGAGTLFPQGALHPDSTNVELYTKLSQNTDDLWWYFQARRNGTLVRRLAGFDGLAFIEQTQEVGLWKTGNQERNEVNLKALLTTYGNPTLHTF